MKHRHLLVPAAAAAASVGLAVTAANAGTPSAARSLHLVSADSYQVGSRVFLGRTTLQVTSAFGRPDARTTHVVNGRVASVQMRYGRWTIAFKRRSADGKLLAWSARSTDPLLTGTHGNRVLAPWFGGAGIQGALVRELGYASHASGGWILRQPYSTATHSGRLECGNFPRTITWGIAGGTRWVQFATDLDVEFPAS